MELILQLTRPAKKSGGDRYEADMEGQDKPFVIYLPQSFTRKSGTPVPMIGMKLVVKED